MTHADSRSIPALGSFSDSKPIILIPQLGSNGLSSFSRTGSGWAIAHSRRSLSAKINDQSFDDLLRHTQRIGRKAVLVTPASGMKLASAIAEAHKDRVSDIVVLNASHYPDVPPCIRSHFISSGWSLFPALAALPQVLRNIRIELIEAPSSVVRVT
jgi:pimeloyl-ACP methyl ester carboxylesterase